MSLIYLTQLVNYFCQFITHRGSGAKLILQYFYQGYPLQTHDVHLHIIHFLRGGGFGYKPRIQFGRRI